MEMSHCSSSPDICHSLPLCRFMSCPVSGSPYMCVSAGALSLHGGRVHTSLFVLWYEPNTLAVALPFLIRSPHSISAMQEGRSVLILL